MLRSPVLVDPPSRRVIHDDGREAVVDPRSMKVLAKELNNGSYTRGPPDPLGREFVCIHVGYGFSGRYAYSCGSLRIDLDDIRDRI